MIDLCIHFGYASMDPKKPLPNLTATATSSFFPASLRVPTKFQASHTAERRFEVHEYYWCVTPAFGVFVLFDGIRAKIT